MHRNIPGNWLPRIYNVCQNVTSSICCTPCCCHEIKKRIGPEWKFGMRGRWGKPIFLCPWPPPPLCDSSALPLTQPIKSSPKYYKNSRILLKIYTSHLPPSDLLNPHPSDPRSDNPKTNSDPRKSHVRCDPALSRCPCKKFLCASLSLHNKPF